ncbi:unnamed protein product [Leuciscus chuanchicus]
MKDAADDQSSLPEVFFRQQGQEKEEIELQIRFVSLEGGVSADKSGLPAALAASRYLVTFQTVGVGGLSQARPGWEGIRASSKGWTAFRMQTDQRDAFRPDPFLERQGDLATEVPWHSPRGREANTCRKSPMAMNTDRHVPVLALVM